MRLLLVLALLVALPGCAAFSDEAPGSADGVQVATAFYPLQYVAQRVAGDLAGVENLTQPGKEPHDLELTVAETAAVADADLVIHELGFQPGVDDAITHAVTGSRTGPGGQRGNDSDSSAAGSHPHTGSSDKPLPGPATTDPRTPLPTAS